VRAIAATPRLSLRELAESDAAFILELLNSPDFIANIGDRGVRNVDDAARYIRETALRSYAERGHGLWRVSLRANDLPVGISGLLYREYLAAPDIGYAFLPQYFGQGFATEAGTAVLDYGRRTLGLTRIVSIVAAENAASIQVLRKLGLCFERVVKSAVDGRDLELYA
jgi:RimJ/RimL family protein N-acetyltransferase